MTNGTRSTAIAHLFAACVLLATAVSSHPALAQNMITPSYGLQDYPGTGLSGVYYDNGAGDSSANGSPPEASFTTTNLCFPDCLGNSFNDGSGGLAAFTNGNATNIVPLTESGMLRGTWNNSELDISGYLAITTPGTYTFTVGSDDDTYITLGNQSFMTVLGGGPQQMSETFSTPGLYQIAVQFFEFTGGSRLSVVLDDSNGDCILGCYVQGQIQPNDLFYSNTDLENGAPAPVIGGGWPSLAFLALIGAGAALRLSRPARP
jgi:hypothetical protein